ncbi:hypothetical protein D3C85_1702370 [compost metagenome]
MIHRNRLFGQHFVAMKWLKGPVDKPTCEINDYNDVKVDCDSEADCKIFASAII